MVRGREDTQYGDAEIWGKLEAMSKYTKIHGKIWSRLVFWIRNHLVYAYIICNFSLKVWTYVLYSHRLCINIWS